MTWEKNTQDAAEIKHGETLWKYLNNKYFKIERQSKFILHDQKTERCTFLEIFMMNDKIR